MEKITSLLNYESTYKESLGMDNEYFGRIAESFQWTKKWSKVQSGTLKDCNVKWFEDGQLNITENCLDRHLEKNGDKTAIIFEANDPKEKAVHISYKKLHEMVCQMGNVLKENGVKKGDRVIIYMGMVPELLTSVLACARIGAIHSVVFGGFSAGALSGRINDCKAKLLITCDGSHRGDKTVPLKEISDEALKNSPSIEKVLVLKRTNQKVDMVPNRDLWLNDLLKKASTKCPFEIMNSEDPLFILYTSGSTGKPKGLLHTTGGYMVWSAYTFNNVFQYNTDDIFWCSADIGWITGHSYIAYGPLLNGATQVMFEGIPTYPNASRFWNVIDEHKVTHFYTAPTAIRALMAFGLSFIEKNSLTSLKVLGSVGEPINEEAWHWYHDHIGKGQCPIVDTWWQTETGGIMISNLAGITPHKPSFATKPLPGVELVLLDEHQKEIKENKAEGALCIKRPWPGMARTIWGDHERYRKTYFSDFPGYYFTGDGAKRDDEGDYRITGRIDDLINVSGHLLSTAEVENLLNAHENVVESAVVGYPHEIKGQAIYAYVISPNPDSYKKNKEQFEKELKDHVSAVLGPICKPELIQLVPGLPKTRSGKIMRRILRKIAANDIDNLGDTSTLLNPEIVPLILKGRNS